MTDQIEPFGKAMGKVFKEAKDRIGSDPTIGGTPIDKAVKEQFDADIDRIIEHHHNKKEWPW